MSPESQPEGATRAAVPECYELTRPDGRRQQFEAAAPFIDAVVSLVPTLSTLDELYAFWEANLASFSKLRARASPSDRDRSTALVAALKVRARRLGNVSGGSEDSAVSNAQGAAALAAPKDRRLRSKDHLAFVGRQPCLVCGRLPAHAHHLRFAQPRAMGLKVSDEFTVPLCAGHHDAVHKTGDERAWWARHGIIEPLKFAERLWAASQQGKSEAIDVA